LFVHNAAERRQPEWCVFSSDGSWPLGRDNEFATLKKPSIEKAGLGPQLNGIVFKE
jgi:hypothetical protein